VSQIAVSCLFDLEMTPSKSELVQKGTSRTTVPWSALASKRVCSAPKSINHVYCLHSRSTTFMKRPCSIRVQLPVRCISYSRKLYLGQKKATNNKAFVDGPLPSSVCPKRSDFCFNWFQEYSIFLQWHATATA